MPNPRRLTAFLSTPGPFCWHLPRLCWSVLAFSKRFPGNMQEKRKTMASSTVRTAVLQHKRKLQYPKSALLPA